MDPILTTMVPIDRSQSGLSIGTIFVNIGGPDKQNCFGLGDPDNQTFIVFRDPDNHLCGVFIHAQLRRLQAHQELWGTAEKLRARARLFTKNK